MVRRTLALLALAALVAASIAAPASAQTLDDILAKNLKAKGGLERIKAVKTIRMTGTMTLGPGMEAALVVEQKRPNSMRMEFTLQGMTGVQAYDGNVGWQIMPFSGRTAAEPLAEDELKGVQEQADFDGPLTDYKAKGHTVELVGKEKVEGSDAYKLKLTLKNGDVRYIFLDADQFLEVRMEGKTKVRGTDVESESTLGDYKEVGGLMLPHAVESGQRGSPQKMKMTIQKVELDVPIDDARFKMPAAK